MSEASSKKTVIKKRRIVRVGNRSSETSSDPLITQVFSTVVVEVILSILFVICISLVAVWYIHGAFLRPYMEALTWSEERAAREQTYPAFDCNEYLEDAVSTQNPADLLISSDHQDTPALVDLVMEHGGAVFPDLISPQDARDLRDYLIHQSLQKDGLPLISRDNRRSIAISALEHESIPRALKSISSSQLLNETLTGLLGPNPALMALSTIIAEKGAEHQNFHVDKPPSGSAMLFTKTFSPNYALLIPLQDTTASMGATAMTPGTHRCYDLNRSLAESKGFPPIDAETGIWKAGHGLLYSGQVRHRGSANDSGPTRAVLILTFGSRPARRKKKHRDDAVGSPSHDGRQLPLLSYFALRWDMWGFSYNDLSDPERFMAYPWIRALGLWKHPESDWGWTAVHDFCALVADHEYGKLGKTLYTKLQRIPVVGTLSSAIMIDWNEGGQEGAPYEMYFVRLTQRLLVILLAMTVYICMQYTTYVKTTNPKEYIRVTFRLLAIYFLTLVLVGSLTRQIMSQTDLHFPSSPNLGLASIDRPTVEPQFNDVLVSVASEDESSPLAAYGRILDYHEANIRWRAYARSINLDKVVKESTVMKGVQDLVKDGRFLQQVEAGWIEMTPEEVYDETMKLANSFAKNGECQSDLA